MDTWVTVKDAITGAYNVVNPSFPVLQTPTQAARRLPESRTALAWRLALPLLSPFIDTQDLVQLARTCGTLRRTVTAPDAAPAWRAQREIWAFKPTAVDDAAAPRYLCGLARRFRVVQATLARLDDFSASSRLDWRGGATSADLLAAEADLGFAFSPWLRALLITRDGHLDDNHRRAWAPGPFYGRSMLSAAAMAAHSRETAFSSVAAAVAQTNDGLAGARFVPLAVAWGADGDLVVDCATDAEYKISSLRATRVATDVADFLRRVLDRD